MNRPTLSLLIIRFSRSFDYYPTKYWSRFRCKLVCFSHESRRM